MRLDLEFGGELPDGWTLLEGVVVLKALDEMGVVRLRGLATPAVSGWESAGMLLWALDSTRDELRGATSTDPDE